MITLLDNYCNMFLTPLLKLNKDWLKKEIKGHRRLVNSYIKHEGLGAYEEDCLSVVIHNYQTTDFKEEEDKILLHPDVIGYYDIADTKYGVIVFNMTRYPDYYLFLEGSYSKFSDWAKQLIIEKYVCREPEMVSAKAILDKSDSLKKLIAERFAVEPDTLDELGSIWNQATQSNILTKEIMLELENSGKIKIKPQL
jgi:hypothetical protein